MPIITISRGCYSHGQEIAALVAEELNYTCINREILVDAAATFDVSKRTLLKSLHDAPGVLERMTGGREKYLNMIRASLLAYARHDNLVYAGHAGHLLLPLAKHVLKVRIIADLDLRIEFLQKRKGLTKSKAMEHIQAEDRHREAWTRYLYQKDLKDPALYDLILHLGRIQLEDAAAIICAAARRQCFAPTFESLQDIENGWVTAQTEAVLQDLCDADVQARKGIVRIRIRNPKIKKTNVLTPKMQTHLDTALRQEVTEEVTKRVKDISGVNQVICEVDPLQYS